MILPMERVEMTHTQRHALIKVLLHGEKGNLECGLYNESKSQFKKITYYCVYFTPKCFRLVYLAWIKTRVNGHISDY
ncbi:unnamed protein product [Phytomonas sp. Hart1]|nr:unnamed protein product [Phytomonas sp. Hart1]|eukprot:CCW72284.1 unnamed protein product [Phytomonas sp. isolate Hart1]